LAHRLARRPVEEDKRDDELRCQQQVWQKLVIEDGALFHRALYDVMPGFMPGIHVLLFPQ
jgi:hypothetical protein